MLFLAHFVFCPTVLLYLGAGVYSLLCPSGLPGADNLVACTFPIYAFTRLLLCHSRTLQQNVRRLTLFIRGLANLRVDPIYSGVSGRVSPSTLGRLSLTSTSNPDTITVISRDVKA